MFLGDPDHLLLEREGPEGKEGLEGGGFVGDGGLRKIKGVVFIKPPIENCLETLLKFSSMMHKLDLTTDAVLNEAIKVFLCIFLPYTFVRISNTFALIRI